MVAMRKRAEEKGSKGRGRGGGFEGRGGYSRPLGRRESRLEKELDAGKADIKDGEKDPLEYRVCQFFLHKFAVSAINVQPKSNNVEKKPVKEAGGGQVTEMQ